jgi:hypothetical protein
MIEAGVDVNLSAEDIQYLEEAYKPMPVLGHT